MKSQTETWKEGSGGEEGRGELVTLDSLLSVCSQGEAEGWEVVEWRVRGESEQGVTYHIRSKWKGGNRRRIGLGNLMRQGGKHWQITRRSSGLVTLRYVNHFGQHFLVASEFWVVFQLYFHKFELAGKKHMRWHEKISKESKLLTFASGLNFGENDQSWRHFHSRPPLLHLVLCLHQTVLNSHRSLTLSLSWWWYAGDLCIDTWRSKWNDLLDRKWSKFINPALAFVFSKHRPSTHQLPWVGEVSIIGITMREKETGGQRSPYSNRVHRVKIEIKFVLLFVNWRFSSERPSTQQLK